MPVTPKSTLRLVMPQWQGGDDPAYRAGAPVLAALLPPAEGPVETISVAPARDGERAPEHGIVSRGALLAQLEQARAAIARHHPDAIVTVGGDCLVDLAPIAYLSERYGDALAVLWVDAHPDVMSAAEFSHAHAHVLAMLMGDGDPDFVAAVPRPIRPSQVLYVGVNDLLPHETTYLGDRGMTCLSPEAVADSTAPVIDWLRASGASKVAVHFDLDVLSPAETDYLLFNRPGLPANAFDGVAKGRMHLAQVAAILRDVAQQAEVVGLAITEFLPWSMIDLGRGLATLPLLSAPAMAELVGQEAARE